MSITLNAQVLKALSAVAVARRLQERMPLKDATTTATLLKKRQKCVSECSALKTVDYDDLSDSAKSVRVDTNLGAKFQYIA